MNNNGVKFRLHGGGNYRLIWQFLRRFIPRLFFDNSTLDRLRNQFADFFAF